MRYDHDDSPSARARQDEQRLAAVCGLDDPVRRRLYEYVAGRAEPVGRDQAAAAAGIGRSLAAYHLDRLVSLGLLTADYRRTGARRGPGAGRPAKVYARSATEFAVTLPPREYELAAGLLAQAVEADVSGAALAGLRVAARRLGSSLGAAGRPPSGDAGGPAAGEPPEHAVSAVLASHGFEPYPDAGLRLRNCPFHHLAARHPGIVCAMNLALLEGVVEGIGAAPCLRPELDPAPGRCCVVIRSAAAAAPGPD